MDIQRIKTLIKQEEGPKLDYKETIDLELESGKKELVKDVIAIANSQGGRGYLIIGIKDKTKEIVGIDPSIMQEERIQQIISNRCDPPVNVRVEYINIDKKYIGVITIFRSYNRPHQMRQTGAFYIRRGSTTDTATRDEIASMLQSSGILFNEQIPLYNISIDVLNEDLINDYLEKTNIDTNLKSNSLLNNLGILHFDRESEQYYPTFGGLMLFCKNPQLYLPHTGIKLIYIKDNKRLVRTFSGNILELLNNSMDFIREIITDREYPLEAIEEGIGNALVHRDYFDKSREMVISIKNNIVISNPGAISQRTSINNIIYEENPYRRNNWIYHKVMIIDDKKRFLKSGLGLQKIKRLLKNYGKVRFINNKRDNIFKTILPGPKKDNK